ncbi:MAG: cysteine-rich secretory family protein [Acidimicrobiaceae bacterium]|nr:MAG: cysteine-rich secretory family protein [Acidimicrobiaceae bacterium]
MSQPMSSPADVRRTRPAFVAVLLVALGLALAACSNGDESTVATDINEVRASLGLSELVRVPELDVKAEAQAERMANRGTIFHSNNLASGVSDGWASIGENVALAGSAQDAQIALEASPGHYANMTNPAYTQVGLGVVSRNGVVYVVQVFVGR